MSRHTVKCLVINLFNLKNKGTFWYLMDMTYWRSHPNKMPVLVCTVLVFSITIRGIQNEISVGGREHLLSTRVKNTCSTIQYNYIIVTIESVLYRVLYSILCHTYVECCIDHQWYKEQGLKPNGVSFPYQLRTGVLYCTVLVRKARLLLQIITPRIRKSRFHWRNTPTTVCRDFRTYLVSLS